MYFYIDESGNTGLELFDEKQPFLYYGVLSSKLNLDVLAQKELEPLRKKFGVDRLHANELGNNNLASICKDLSHIKKKYGLTFDMCRVAKADHAVISFFDQIFDQGMNPTVPWHVYWTPLRYPLLLKVGYLFDEETLKIAWEARKTVNKQKSHALIIEVCDRLLNKLGQVQDNRSREIINNGLRWASKNFEEISYNIANKKEGLQISPNLIGFQSIIHLINSRLEKRKTQARKVVVDRQSQFNKAQELLINFYQNAQGTPFEFGPGLPTMDLQHMPMVPINCTAGTDSAGLELVDIYLWIFKRNLEGKHLANELQNLIREHSQRGKYDEISLAAIAKRWGNWFDELPEPTSGELQKAFQLLKTEELKHTDMLDN